MKGLSFILLLTFLLAGCTSTHSLLAYKLGCKTDPNFLDNEIRDADLELVSENEYSVCEGYKRYKIVRKNLTEEHLDGRKFKMPRVERFFYASYDQSKCELTVVTPLTGRVPDLTDTNYVLDKYYFSPLLNRVSVPKTEKLVSEKLFNSEADFKKYCPKKT